MATVTASLRTRRASALSGWPIVGWAALIVAGLCAAVLVAAGGGEAGWRAAVRLSAKTSLTLFTAALIASSARALWRNEPTRWLLANRRYVGVSFAASHAIHLVAIVMLVRAAPGFALGLPALIGGGLAYMFLAAMTATSFDRTAAWLGPRRWKLLHKTGMYYCWAIFLNSYLPRMLTGSLFYLPLVVVLLGSVALRAAARRR